MSKVPALEITQLSKSFGKVSAVKDLNLSVLPGEIYALLGENGAGKTTTIKMIATLINPDKGSIEILNHNNQNEPVKAKQQLGYIPDEPYIYPYLTGREFLQLTGDLYHIPRKETDQRIKDLLKIYKLENIIDGLFSDYSRGNKQKVIILSALLHQPKLLIIDEPIVGLDVQSQRITKKLFQDFVKNQGSILICTHTLSWIEELADNIGILHQGELVAEGSLAELKKKIKNSKNDLEEIFIKLTS